MAKDKEPKFKPIKGKLKPFDGLGRKGTKFPSDKMIKDGEASRKKAEAAEDDLPGGGYKRGGRVKAKKKKPSKK